jgi:hypothetical protein
MLIDLRTDGLNIYFLCPFIGCFCLIGASFSSGQSKFGKYPFLENILVSVSQIFAIIPYLISVKIKKESYMNTQKSNEKKAKDKNALFNDEIDPEQSRIKITDAIILGFSDFFHSMILYFGNDIFKNKFKFFFMSSNILFLTILQKYILKNRIYRHQVASFIIFFALDIIYLSMIFIDDLLNFSGYILIFVSVSNLFLSFEITYEKKILKNQYVSFYRLCVFIGIVSLIFNLIASIITTIVEFCLDNDDKYKVYLFNYKYYLEDVDDHVLVEIILIFVFVILNGVYNILQVLTIKYLSPNHVLITYVMLAIYYSILIKFQEIEITTLTFIFSIVFHIICFFALFIFLEIIQLNFCGINKDYMLKNGVRSDVDKYMQSFSSNSDEHDNEIFDDNANNTNQMNDKTSELETFQID